MKDWETAFDEKFFISDFNSEDCYKEIKKYIKKALSSQLKEVLGVIESKKERLLEEGGISEVVYVVLDDLKAELSQLAEGEE